MATPVNEMKSDEVLYEVGDHVATITSQKNAAFFWLAQVTPPNCWVVTGSPSSNLTANGSMTAS